MLGVSGYRDHRDVAAFLAIAFRLAAESFTALDFPPFSPPARPLRSVRFFRLLTVSSVLPVAISTMSLASWFGSRGRFAMPEVCHG